MKTKKLKSFSKILKVLTLTLCLMASSFAYLIGGITKVASAYTATDFLSTTTHSNYDFEKQTTSGLGWTANTNYTYDSVNSFAGSGTGLSIVPTEIVSGLTYKDTNADGTNDTMGLDTDGDGNIDIAFPTTRFDGSSVLASSTAADCDNYVLGILANKAPVKQVYYAEDDTEHTTPLYRDVNYSFQVSSSLTLNSNSFYCISFWVYTSNGTMASIRLGGDFDYESATLTGDSWTQYHLFVATNTDASNSMNVFLQYGNKNTITPGYVGDSPVSGYVLFDNMHIETITETDYLNQSYNGTAVAHSLTYTPRSVVSQSAFDGEFETLLDIYPYFSEQGTFDKMSSEYNNSYWYYYAPEDLTTSSKAQYNTLYNSKTGTVPNYFIARRATEQDEFATEKDGVITLAPNSFNADNHVLGLENYSADYSLGLISKPFTIDQFGIYKISVMIRTTNASSTGKIMLVSSIPTGAEGASEGGKTYSATTSAISANKTNDITNNWTESVLYVRGSAFSSSELQIVLLADSGSTVYFDHIEVERTTSTAYSNGSIKLDLSPSAVLQTTTITNGFFNFADVTKVGEPEYPLAPSNWTSTITKYEKGEIVSGVMPTNDVSFNGPALGDAINPISTTERVNVLAIYANSTITPGADTKEFYYANNSDFSLSASKVYKITFDVYTQKTLTDSNFNGKVIARLIYSSNTITDFIEEYTEGTNTWQTYTIYVRAGASAKSVKLQLGIQDANGTVFFRNVKYTALADKTVNGEAVSVEAQYNNAFEANNTWALQKTNKIRFADFYNDNATLHTTKPIDTYTNLFESKNYTVTNNGKDSDNKDLNGKIYIATNEADLTLGTGDNQISIPAAALERTGSKSNSVLVLFNETELYSYAAPKASISLAASGFYKLSVWVKTNNAVGENFTVNFKNVDTTFNKVNTYNSTDATSSWTEYVAYVRTGASAISAVQIEFQLGTASSKAKGYALISDINYETLTEETYTTATENLTGEEPCTKVVSYYVAPTTDKTDSSTASNDDAKDQTLLIFFVVFSSLLTVVALIIALVAIGVKKLPKNKKVVGVNQANVSVKDSTGETNNPRKDGFV